MPPYYRRGLAFAQTAYLPAPTGGWAPDVSLWELPDNQAAVLDNFLIRNGKVVSRGPIIRMASPAVSNWIAGGVFIDSQSAAETSGAFVLQHKLDSATQWIDPWNAPLRNAAAANLAAGTGTIQKVRLDDGTVTAGAAYNADTALGPRSVNFGGLLYVISYDSAAAAVSDANTNYHIKPLNLLTVSASVATASTSPTITVLSNAPHGAFDVTGYLSRVWLLGGVDTPGGLSVHEPTTLYYTNAGDAGIGTASADWKDPVFGTTNKLRMDNDQSDFGVGFGRVPNALLVFRHGSVWALRGTTSTSFVLRAISHEVGCIDARSIVETDKGVFWLSHRGLMFTDGTIVRNVSGPVQIDLTTAIQEVLNKTHWAQRSPMISAGLTSLGQVIVSVASHGSADGSIGYTTTWSGMYDPNGGAWVRVTSLMFGGGMLPIWLAGRPNRQQLYSIGSSTGTSSVGVVQLENGAIVESTGSSAWGHSFLLPNNAQNALFDKDKTGVLVLQPINHQWVTKLFPMSASHYQGSVKRWFIDYTLAHASGVSSVTNGWTVQPFSSNPTNSVDNSLAAATQLSVGTNVAPTTIVGPGPQMYPTAPFVSRTNVEANWELNDVYFYVRTNMSTAGTNPGPGLAEIYGLGMEYFPTREYEGGGGATS